MSKPYTFLIPKVFFIDHRERDLPTPAARETSAGFRVRRSDPHLADLLADARFYADPHATDCLGSLRVAARGLVRCLERNGVV